MERAGSGSCRCIERAEIGACLSVKRAELPGVGTGRGVRARHVLTEHQAIQRRDRQKHCTVGTVGSEGVSMVSLLISSAT